MIYRALFFLILLFCGSAIFLQPRLAADEPFRAALISDTHLGFKKSDEAFKAFLSEMRSFPLKINVLINNGDIAEVGSQRVFEAYEAGVHSLSITAFNVIGNHDTRWTGHGKELFAQAVGPRYFSKDFEGIHWMFLDSTLEHQTQGHLDHTQINWIKKDLDSVPADEPVLVFSHHPLKWRGTSIDNGLDALNLFDGHTVAAFINGHGHKLEKVRFRGIPFIENDALFNGHYLILEKSGNHLNLFIKTLGKSEFSAWGEIPLHPPSPGFRILEPKLNANAAKRIVPVKLSAGEDSGAFLQVDHEPPVPLESQSGVFWQNVELKKQGWHSLRLVTSKNPWGEDQTHVFSPGEIESFPLGEIYAGLAADGKFVFAATLDGTFYALDFNGKTHWARKLDGGILAAPYAAGDTVYVGTRQGTLYALKTKNGAILWEFKRSSGFAAPPYVWGNQIYVGCGDKTFYALDASTGKEKWHASLGDFTEMQATAKDGIVYVGAWDRSFYAFEALTGRMIWKKSIGKSIYFSPSVARPVLSSNTVFLAAKDHQVYALDSKTGETKWMQEVNDGFSSPLLVNNQLILLETGGKVVSLNPETGTVSWTKQLPTSFYNASPLVHEEHLVLIGVDGQYIKMDLKEQTVETLFQISRGWNFSTPVIAGNKLWVGSLDGHLYAIPISSVLLP